MTISKFRGIWDGKEALIRIRAEEYKYIFLPENFDVFSLKNKITMFFGELWWSYDQNIPMILLRAPFEIRVIQ